MLLKRLKYMPVAMFLAFVVAGLPAAPAADLLPSSGVALAHCGGKMGPDGIGPPTPPDFDCDGISDDVDICAPTTRTTNAEKLPHANQCP